MQQNRSGKSVVKEELVPLSMKEMLCQPKCTVERPEERKNGAYSLTMKEDVSDIYTSAADTHLLVLQPVLQPVLLPIMLLQPVVLPVRLCCLLFCLLLARWIDQ